MDRLVNSITVAGRRIGPGHPCFVIAEAGVNHNGNLDFAKRLVDAAKEALADAVKFQTFKAERVATEGAPKAKYQLETTDSSQSQFEMLKRLELSEAQHRTLKTYCEEREIIFLSTPFDEASADFLDSLGVAAFKVPSGELTNTPLIRHVAKKNKPLIVSTGMAYLQEVRAAVADIRAAGNKELVLLHCVSDYPAHPAQVNLLAIKTLSDAFGVPCGYSDHTLGIEIALAAMALGACVIEKHVTLSKELKGPDHRASLEPREFKALVEGIRKVEQAFGNGVKAPAAGEQSNRKLVRRSLTLIKDVPRGALIEAGMLTALRPGDGISPSFFSKVIERRAKKALSRGVQISWEDLE